jgi:hypothetical protein
VLPILRWLLILLRLRTIKAATIEDAKGLLKLERTLFDDEIRKK